MTFETPEHRYIFSSPLNAMNHPTRNPENPLSVCWTKSSRFELASHDVGNCRDTLSLGQVLWVLKSVQNTNSKMLCSNTDFEILCASLCDIS